MASKASASAAAGANYCRASARDGDTLVRPPAVLLWAKFWRVDGRLRSPLRGAYTQSAQEPTRKKARNFESRWRTQAGRRSWRRDPTQWSRVVTRNNNKRRGGGDSAGSDEVTHAGRPPKGDTKIANSRQWAMTKWWVWPAAMAMWPGRRRVGRALMTAERPSRGYTGSPLAGTGPP